MMRFHRAGILLNIASLTRSFTTSPLPELLNRAGISRIAFIRHGNTGPKPPDGTDFDRTLTPSGKNQAAKGGASYGRNVLEPIHPSVLCSPAPRTVDTASLFLHGVAATAADCDELPPPARFELVPVRYLYDGTMQPKGSVLFQKLGYASLRTYLHNPDDDDRVAAEGVLGDYGNNALKAIAEVATERRRETVDEMTAAPGGEEGVETLLLFGHAVYLPAAALAVARCCNVDSGVDLILDTNTKEVEGYLVDCLGDEGVSLLSLPV
eukprot:CAMPEP_0172488416 /NCGR_PEP_ID=MMETSP1066-20121228/17927_1 /TAXON_ID=671091 /ORGANISM="Coscinodiscus wailesii, Strain CCMP2513" /LENGTH=265 /DNA_ID=CAMNT_0013255617 /DNA_START=48 /DNA_END=845 /DNA_ORIENTATION=-